MSHSVECLTDFMLTVPGMSGPESAVQVLCRSASAALQSDPARRSPGQLEECVYGVLPAAHGVHAAVECIQRPEHRESPGDDHSRAADLLCAD